MRNVVRLAILILGATLAAGPRVMCGQTIDGERISFNDDIRPILAANCLPCHGFDPSTREAGLRLDTRDGALAVNAAGRAAIVPGDPAASMLLDRITAHDALDRMPPDGRDALPPEQVALIRRWIEQGASYDRHWSFKPIQDPQVPAVSDPTWPRDDVDRFILARLDQHGLSPAASADRHTLLRRAHFALTGLPPTPEQVRAFVNNDPPDAFAKVVDTLLASPRFGERWARHWLDLMRYAETHGHEFDYPIHHAWKYRDYVIRALNADVPYDQFVREHIAGDLLDQPRRHPTEQFNESIIATGWWWLSQGTHGPVDVRADEAERIDNQIDVLSRTFLGLTVSCARCHDHKFDPITQHDFYALAGFVQSSRRQEAYLDPGGRIAASIAELEEARRALAASVAHPHEPAAETYLNMLQAAVEVVSGRPLPSDPPVEPEFIIFDDFEDGTYDRWTIEGTAFGSEPYSQDTLAQYQGKVGAHGERFVNSHNARNGENVQQADQHTGRMISQPFTIGHQYVHFLIGGGAHRDHTCFNLVVDGRVVRTAEGRNNNTMRRERWNVSEFIGKVGHFEIVDRETDGWGHIGIDHITFSDRAAWRLPVRRPIQTVANEAGIEPGVLSKWVEAARDDRFDWLRASAMFTPPEPNEEYVAIEQIGGDEAWYPAGFAFSHSGQRGLPAHSGAVAGRLQGTLRSPTFELTHPHIHYLVSGRGRIRLVIDGYYLDEYNPLLFEGMTFDVKSTADRPWYVHTQPILDKYIGHRAYIEIIDDSDDWIAVRDIWFSNTSAGPTLASAPDTEGLAAFAAQLAQAGDVDALRTRPELQATRGWMVDHGIIVGAEDPEIAAHLERERVAAASIPPPMRVLAMTDGTPEDEYIFIRGDHHQLGNLARRGFIGILAGENQPTITHGSGRLALADRMLDPSNPLPARVIVNRVWQHVFGAPLVPTPDDFGALGTPPEHVELLDHLAYWFAHDADWSIKALIRRLMLTRTYQMASTHHDAAAESIDPTNALFHRMNITRLEGEAIRDAALAVSHQLDDRMYGPPVEVHLTPFMQGRGRPGRSGPLDGNGRRSIYIAIRRNFLSPMMLAFDTPVPHSTVGRRNVSNVPAQSLILMNDPFFVEQARLWGEHVLALEVSDPRDRIAHLYLQALARHPTGAEQDAAIGFLESTSDDWQTNPVSWAELCHVLYNVKEFIFVR